jgi:hypothetical protein
MKAASPKANMSQNRFRLCLAKRQGFTAWGRIPCRFTVYSSRSDELLRVSANVLMERLSPNGVVCGPTCFVAGLRLNVGKHRLERLSREEFREALRSGR